MKRQSYAVCLVSLILLLFLVPTGNLGAISKESTKDALRPLQSIQCIDYDSVQKLIEVRCQSVHLTDIYNLLGNPSILRPELDENQEIGTNQTKVWILNAGIVVDKEGSLIIDSTDTSWLKMIPAPTIQLMQKSSNVTEDTNYSDDTLTVIQTDNSSKVSNTNNLTKVGNGTIVVSKHNGDNPNGIHVHGSLKIDSVKITSWDPKKNDVIRFDFGKRTGEEHTKSDYDTAEPRAFIRVSKDATGSTNITNSEIAYLGYSCSRCAGLSYYGGEGSVIKNNNMHHLLKGFYSKNAGHITIDNNSFHNNYLYGIDPHTGSHDFTITNNLVYNNNASGIICSKDCYNLLIEGNEVYNNSGAARGIAFSINTTNSIAKNNYIHDQPRCISFNRISNYNEVYNNTVSGCKTGIYLSGTSNNSIHHNHIVNVSNGISFKSFKNHIYNNNILNATNGIIFHGGSSINETNNRINDTYHETRYHDILANVAANNSILNTDSIMKIKKESIKETAKD